MKKQLILFAILWLSINPLFSQIDKEEEDEIELEFDLSSYGYNGDSIRDMKMKILLEEMKLPQRIMEISSNEIISMIKYNMKAREKYHPIEPKVLKSSFDNIVQSESLQVFMNDLIYLYIKSFTLEELQTISEFYQSPVGTKAFHLEIITGGKLLNNIDNWNIIINEVLDEHYPDESSKSKKAKKKKKRQEEKLNHR